MAEELEIIIIIILYQRVRSILTQFCTALVRKLEMKYIASFHHALLLNNQMNYIAFSMHSLTSWC